MVLIEWPLITGSVHGGVGLIITGGFAPNYEGRVNPFASQLSFRWQLKNHRKITQAVHEENGKIALQILHAAVCLPPF